MIDLILTMLIVTVGTAYIVQYLLLVRKNSHHGFLSSRSKVIKFPEAQQERSGFTEVTPEHVQPVVPIDYLRRLFNAFDIKNDVWIVTDNADLWTCPFCLSFWIAFGGTFTVANLYDLHPLIIAFSHLAIAFGAQKLVDFSHQEGIVE